MENKTQNQKSQKFTYTALVISPPQENWEQIQNIRKQFDKAYDRWMPHINICFPFLAPDKFDDFEQNMNTFFEQIDPFQINFNNLNYFEHAKQNLMYAEPKDENNGIQQVYQAIKSQYPYLNDAEEKGHGIFTPHMTLGQFKKQNFQNTFQQQQSNWKNIQFTCDQVHLIFRDRDDPFKVIKVLKLGKQN